MSSAVSEGRQFAEWWIAAWNNMDVDGALKLCSDTFEFSSPLATEITGSGFLQGRGTIESYWRSALARTSHLHFELQSAFWDPDARTVTVLYRRERGSDVRLAVEIFKLDDGGQAVSGIALHGTAYSDSDRCRD